MKRAVAGLIVAGGVCAPAAMSQEAGLTQLYACAEIADANARLACFDREVAGLAASEADGDVAVVTREQVEAANESSFGSGLSARIGEVAPTVAARAEEPSELSMTVASVSETSSGRLRMTMQNGQVWEQTDNRPINANGDGPWPATVSKGMFGSYFVKIDGQRRVRAKRVS